MRPIPATTHTSRPSQVGSFRLNSCRAITSAAQKSFAKIAPVIPRAPKMIRRTPIIASPHDGWPRVLRPFFPVPKLWVPRPCVSCKGGYRCCRYHGMYHAQRPASHLRCASLALYHLFLLSTIAISEPHPQPRPLPLDSRTGTPAIPIRGCGICRDAGTYPSAHHRTRDRKPSKIMQVLKQRTARALLPKRKRKDSRQASLFGGHSLPRAFWQARFYDFNVWTTKSAWRS